MVAADIALAAYRMLQRVHHIFKVAKAGRHGLLMGLQLQPAFVFGRGGGLYRTGNKEQPTKVAGALRAGDGRGQLLFGK